MWQRPQTLFLAVAIIALLVSLVFPIWTIEGGDVRVLTAFYYREGDAYNYNPYSLAAILAFASATLAFTEITKYKNRITQIKIGALNSLFMVGTAMTAFYFSNQLMKSAAGTVGHYGMGMWLPFVAVLCNLVANRLIRRDEKLVRDSDRLR